MSLDSLLQRADIWRGGKHSLREASASVSTGYPELDAHLPGGGWPCGALTELLFEHSGIGELQLLLPALARLSQTGRWLAWVAPPYLPYAPALAAGALDLSRVLLVQPKSEDALWAMEQTLRSGACGAVLGWPANPDNRVLRRLQLAAETGDALALLFRPLRDKAHASPAALRLQLEPTPDGLIVQILKRRGGWASGPILMQERHHALA